MRVAECTHAEVNVLRRWLCALASAGLLATGGWIVGCSGNDGPGQQPTTVPSLPNDPAPGNGSNGSTQSGNGSTSSSSTGSSSVDACLASCAAQHPSGAQKNSGIDQCWSQSCSDVCDGIGSTGAEFGPTSGSCKTDVKTPSSACSTCTVKHCCSAWDACFSDADCIALNTCSIACYK